MFFENDELTLVANVAKTHGLAGQLSLKIHQDFSNNTITEKMPVFLLTEGIPVPFFVEFVKNSGSYRVVKLKHIDSEEKAKSFLDCKIYVLSSAIIKEEEDDDELCEFDGFAVYDKKHGFIGTFSLLNMIPGNPVFETTLDNKTIIIPFVDEFIVKIDYEKKEIHISAPEGLIEMYL